jgi:hypothetical protein
MRLVFRAGVQASAAEQTALQRFAFRALGGSVKTMFRETAIRMDFSQILELTGASLYMCYRSEVQLRFECSRTDAWHVAVRRNAGLLCERSMVPGSVIAVSNRDKHVLVVGTASELKMWMHGWGQVAGRMV